MGFKSINEIEQFNFDDCVVTEFVNTGNELRLTLEALIVKSRNSQNTNFTESYADTVTVVLKNAKILSGVKDGLKYYNADGILLNEIPDSDMSVKEIKDLLVSCSGAYLYAMDKEGEADGTFNYCIGMEFIDKEDNTIADSYRLHVSHTEAVFKWERYLNRVQS